MAPLTRAQVELLTITASNALQQIQDELGRDTSGGKVRFPRGYIRKVSDRIGKLSWVANDTFKRNLCYHMLYADVLRWLLNRTDIYGPARNMISKHMIAVMGAAVEGLTLAAMKQLGHGKRNYGKRLEQLLRDGAIDGPLKIELEWLWEARSRVHIFEVTELELDAYPVPDGNRAILAVRALSEQLRMKFALAEFEDLGP